MHTLREWLNTVGQTTEKLHYGLRYPQVSFAMASEQKGYFWLSPNQTDAAHLSHSQHSCTLCFYQHSPARSSHSFDVC